jgi:hypothetical protein
MPSHRQSKTTSKHSASTVAVGIIILIVPIVSLLYLFRKATDKNDNEQHLEDTSEEDDGLAYGPDSSSDVEDEASWKQQVIPKVTLTSSSIPVSPAVRPVGRPQQQPMPQHQTWKEDAQLAGLAVTAAAIGAPIGYVKPSSRYDDEGSDGELVNAGSMQIKGIRSVRGEYGDRTE